MRPVTPTHPLRRLEAAGRTPDDREPSYRRLKGSLVRGKSRQLGRGDVGASLRAHVVLSSRTAISTACPRALPAIASVLVGFSSIFRPGERLRVTGSREPSLIIYQKFGANPGPHAHAAVISRCPHAWPSIARSLDHLSTLSFQNVGRKEPRNPRSAASRAHEIHQDSHARMPPPRGHDTPMIGPSLRCAGDGRARPLH